MVAYSIAKLSERLGRKLEVSWIMHFVMYTLPVEQKLYIVDSGEQLRSWLEYLEELGLIDYDRGGDTVVVKDRLFETAKMLRKSAERMANDIPLALEYFRRIERAAEKVR